MITEYSVPLDAADLLDLQLDVDPLTSEAEARIEEMASVYEARVDAQCFKVLQGIDPYIQKKCPCHVCHHVRSLP